MYITQGQQGATRQKNTNTEQKYIRSRCRKDRYKLSNDDLQKIMEQEQKEFNDGIDNMDIRPKPIKCTCLSTHGIDMWTTSEPTDEQVACRTSDYNVKMHVLEHFYNCILGSYIIRDCCNIVEGYVGTLYAMPRNLLHVYTDVYKIVRWTYVSTFGLTMIDYWDEMFINNSITMYECNARVHNGRCVVPKCKFMAYISGSKYLCYEHYHQWQELPETFIHNHKCRECRHKGKCRGHKFPRKYKCEKCERHNKRRR